MSAVITIPLAMWTKPPINGEPAALWLELSEITEYEVQP